jgi:AcrR family transcriptional regulator
MGAFEVTATKIKSSPRERILATAQQLFYGQGYRATGINQIIKEANVAKASFYQHFASKDDLALAYLQEIGRLSQCGCESVLSDKSNPREALLKLFDFIEQQFIKSDYQGCPMQNLTSEVSLQELPLHQDAVVNKKDHIRRDIHETVAALKNSSQHHAQLDVDEVSNALFLLVEGAMTTSRIYRDTWPFGSARQAAESLLS